jgi:hypothetical protein
VEKLSTRSWMHTTMDCYKKNVPSEIQSAINHDHEDLTLQKSGGIRDKNKMKMNLTGLSFSSGYNKFLMFFRIRTFFRGKY